jgi:2-phosphosulfolactate phosphatase
MVNSNIEELNLNNMKVQYLNCREIADTNSIVCVIDVISAFTTAAYLFDSGADKIRVPKSVDETLALKQENTQYILVGEANNIKVEGFDYGNSAVDIKEISFSQKKVALKTTSGTKGLWNSYKSKKIFAASFVNAKATAKFLKQATEQYQCENIAFVITNNYKSAEDSALANYLCEMLFKDIETSPSPYLELVDKSLYGNLPTIEGIREEIPYIIDANKYNFAMVFEPDSIGNFYLNKYSINS